MKFNIMLNYKPFLLFLFLIIFLTALFSSTPHIHPTRANHFHEKCLTCNWVQILNGIILIALILYFHTEFFDIQTVPKNLTPKNNSCFSFRLRSPPSLFPVEGAFQDSSF